MLTDSTGQFDSPTYAATAEFAAMNLAPPAPHRARAKSRPRPPVAAEVEKYEPWQRRRLAVKPGLKCLWQVSGRSEIEFEDWVRMDLWYVRNQSLTTDIRLLARTPASVVSGRGAY